MSAAVVNSADGTAMYRETIGTLASRGPDDGMNRLCNLIKRVVEHSRVSQDAIVGIGVGCTGPVDTIRGLVQNPYTLPTWDDLPIVDILTQVFQKPTLLLNDAHVAALGEHAIGAGRDTLNMIYITVSTGIGGGIILNEHLYRGAGLMAGEVGHQSLDFNGRPCYCGGRGCWEMYAAGPAIAKMAQARVSPVSQLWTLAEGHTSAITARMVGEAAQQGDALAVDLLRETGTYLGVGIANLLNILAPEMIVLGGGVMQSQGFILPAIRERLQQQNFLVPADKIRIVPAELGLNAGVIGASFGLIRFLENKL